MKPETRALLDNIFTYAGVVPFLLCGLSGEWTHRQLRKEPKGTRRRTVLRVINAVSVTIALLAMAVICAFSFIGLAK